MTLIGRMKGRPRERYPLSHQESHQATFQDTAFQNAKTKEKALKKYWLAGGLGCILTTSFNVLRI